MPQVIVLELNELNFMSLQRYIGRGDCPHFKTFFERHGYCQTTSEVCYAELEPWIQWVTAHTGLTFGEHRIFRLGDAVDANVRQIWEQLEAGAGIRVGAFCPMNAVNQMANPAFFVPDPWTATPASGPWILRGLSKAVSQAVNENTTGKLQIRTLFLLAIGFIWYARPTNYFEYLRLVLKAIRYSWHRVLFLDLFLSDVFVKLNRKTNPAFSSFFLNGAANLQHHYMFNSLETSAENLRNPEWYLPLRSDPVGDIYKIYDRVLGQLISMFPNHRILIMTGLHQELFHTPTFYWRLRNHADFLCRLGCEFVEVRPRMSRDFELRFDDTTRMIRAQSLLLSSRVAGEPVFSVDQRRNSLFVELVFARDLKPDEALVSEGLSVPRFLSHVAFVALKNGHHSGVGYLSDSGNSVGGLPSTIRLSEIHGLILQMFGAKSVKLESGQLAR